MFKTLSPAIFVLALLCFLLPWVDLSCQGQQIARFTGLDLLIGTTAQGKRVEKEPLAGVAFGVALLGLAVSLWKGKKGALGSALAGGLGVAVLFLLKSKLDKNALENRGGAVHLDYLVGFYLLWLLFLLALVLNVYYLMPGKGPPDKK